MRLSTLLLLSLVPYSASLPTVVRLSIRPGPTTEFPDDPLPATATWNLDNLGNWSGDTVDHESVVRTGDFDADGDVDPVPPDTTSFHHAVDAANAVTTVFNNGTAPTTFTTDPSGNLVCDGT